MKYRMLGGSDLNASLIGLGTMTWGGQNTQAEAHQQLDVAMDAGINLVDTAELYPIKPNAETQGHTETYIGAWLAAGGRRDKIILASKAVGPGAWVKYFRDGPRLNRFHIETALDASLRRLKTDYLDLYQLHWPERKTNFFGKLGYPWNDSAEDIIPIDETLEAMDRLVQNGKIRYAGISNETPWGLMRYLSDSDSKNLTRIQTIQNPYSLLNRSFEVGLAEICHRENISLLAYSPLAFGTLSGKYLNAQLPDASRLALFSDYSRYSNPQAVAATESYVQLALDQGLDPVQMALAFVNSRPFVGSTLIGATNLEQLKTNIGSIGLALSTEVTDAIEAIHQITPNPSP